MDLSIVIPCLNEKRTIKRAIAEAYKYLKKEKIKSFEIIVADNGSNDGSQKEVLKSRVAKIVNVPVRGYGAALHYGILKAKGKFVLFADADLSYSFSEIKKFKTFLNQKVDLVLGSRIKGNIKKGAMPFLNRYLGTPVLTYLIRLIYKIKTTDTNSGMRMIRKSFYRKLKMKNSGMEWASELLIKTSFNNGVYREVPINFAKDKRRRSPHLIPWADGWRHLKAIVLLKPNTLLVPIILFLTISVTFLNSYTEFSRFSFLTMFALSLSFLAVKILHMAINNEKNFLVSVLQKTPIVMIAILTTIAWFIFLVTFPSSLGNFKSLISGVITIFDMWVFLIETIKTHLINRLPDKL